MELARGEWRIQDTDDGWTLAIRPGLGGMFWAHVVYAIGWVVLGLSFALATPAAILLLLLAAPAIVAAWRLANDAVVLRVEGEMGALGVEHLESGKWRTLRLAHLTTVAVCRPSAPWLAGLWFLELRSAAGRVYGADYFGPLEFVSYGSKVHFGGAIPAEVAGAVVDAIAARVSAVGQGA